MFPQISELIFDVILFPQSAVLSSNFYFTCKIALNESDAQLFATYVQLHKNGSISICFLSTFPLSRIELSLSILCVMFMCHVCLASFSKENSIN